MNLNEIQAVNSVEDIKHINIGLKKHYIVDFLE